MKYQLLSKLIAWMFPTPADRMRFRTWCKELDNRKNIELIKNNYENLLKKFNNNTAERPIKVLFLVNDIAKWKAQSLYDLMKESHEFKPFIALTLADYQPKLDLIDRKKIIDEAYNFFTSKSMDCVIAYDAEHNKEFNLDEFEPHMVFYQQPWQIAKNQLPLAVSKFALTFYIPYYVQNYGEPYLECHQELHQTIFRYYIIDKNWEIQYLPELKNAAGSIKGLGHTALDIYYKNNTENENKYVIYAPHHSISDWPNFATIQKNGKEILEYAKSHKELNWVFKPHPNLKYRLIKNKIMTQDEANKYYKEWESFATVSYDSDYTKYFLNSKALITDSASFLTEYFCTGKPVIHLISSRANVKAQPPFQKILDTFYEVRNTGEMLNEFNNILIKNNDYAKEKRLKALEESKLTNVYAAENILNDLKNYVKIMKEKEIWQI